MSAIRQPRKKLAKQFEFDLKFQQDLLTLFLKKPTLSQQYKPFLEPEHFQKIIHEDLYRLMLEYEKKYGKMPSQAALSQKCSDFLKDIPGKPDFLKYETTIKTVFSSEVPEEEFTLSLVTAFIRETLTAEACISYSRDRDWEALSEEMTRIKMIGIDQDELSTGGLTGSELMNQEMRPADFLIGRGLMPRTGYVLLAGWAKRGKSTLAVQMGLSLVAGIDFLGTFPIQKKAKILYVSAEGSPAEFKTRFRHEVTGFRVKKQPISDSDLDNFIHHQNLLNLFKPRDQLILRSWLEKYEPDVVFIDPLSLFSGGKDMNKLETAGEFVRILSQLTINRECAFCLIHHYKKPTDKASFDPIHMAIGSSGWGNLCETFIGMSWPRKDTPERRRLDFTMRHAEAPAPLYLWHDPGSWLHEPLEEEEIPRKGIRIGEVIEIIKGLGGSASWKDICIEMKVEHSENSAITTLLLQDGERMGLLEKGPGKRGKWEVRRTTGENSKG